MLDAQIWWKNDNTNSTVEEIGILAATAGYKKIVSCWYFHFKQMPPEYHIW